MTNFKPSDSEYPELGTRQQYFPEGEFSVRPKPENHWNGSNTTCIRRKPSNLCPQNWVGKAVGEGIYTPGRRRSRYNCPDMTSPFINLYFSLP